MATKEERITLGNAFVELGIDWFEENFLEGISHKSNTSVFTAGVTTYLMIIQKSVADDTLASAVQHLKQTTEMDKVAVLMAGSKKFKFDLISNNAGGFSRARQRLPLSKVEEFSDHISSKIEKEHSDISVLHGYRVYVIDGSTIRLQNTLEIKQEFASHSNQYGEHQPAARIVLVNNVVTGTALRPEIGSIKDSEQKLSKALMQRLPRRSVIIGDINFGVFFVAWEATQASLKSLIRLQEQRALSILKQKEITKDGEYQITWFPTKADRENNELPEEACIKGIKGRLIAVTLDVPGRKAERFYFFTTITDLTPQQILEIYKNRWFIETDLRSIKSTINLEQINAKTPDMIRKEIILGIVGYTLIRTVIARGAKALKLQPRQISFSRARAFIITVSIRLAKAQSVKDIQITVGNFLTGLRQCKHPNRTKFRSEPRVIVTKGKHKFPLLKGSRDQARKILISKRTTGC